MAELPLLSPPLTELMLIVAHMTGLIRSVEIDRNFAVVWRGYHPLPTDGSFRLTNHMRTRGCSVALYPARQGACVRHPWRSDRVDTVVNTTGRKLVRST